jgi:hypothetical protein
MLPLVWFLLTLLALAGLTAFSPAERTLGLNARVVYLHGAWVWTALAAFTLAAASGAAGLLLRQARWQRWSLALGQTGLLFWITYLPLSMWGMQTSWNGLFLAEPRWRVAITFALGGLALQLGLLMVQRTAWAAGGNILFFLLLALALAAAENVMHPPSPILNSDAGRIQLFFFLLLGVTWLAAAQVAFGLYRSTRRSQFSPTIL